MLHSYLVDAYHRNNFLNNQLDTINCNLLDIEADAAWAQITNELYIYLDS